MACRVKLRAALALAAWASVATSVGTEPSSRMPRLSVRAVDRTAAPASARSFVIVDEWGREVTLRGVAVETEARAPPPWQVPMSVAAYADGHCPANREAYSNPPVCGVDAGRGKYQANITAPNDFAQIRWLGFNLVRLCISWDRVEPTPGVYDGAFIDRVAQMVDWAAEQDVYVVLDFHEDLYSQYISYTRGVMGLPPLLYTAAGQDGAPRWAVQTGGWPSIAPLAIAQANPAMNAAFQGLWSNQVVPGIPQGEAPGPGLQDHFIGAIAAVGRRFANHTAVAGIELINEPQAGIDTVLDAFAASKLALYSFYKRAVQAVTGVRDGLPECSPGATDVSVVGHECAYPDLGIHYPGLILTEPLAIRNMLDRSLQVSQVWSSYPNLVHAPHVYTHVFTLDQSLPWLAALLLPRPWPPSFEYGYQTAWEEANQMNSAVLVTEFGTTPRLDEQLVRPTLDAQDSTGTSAVLWAWKSNCAWGWPDGPYKCTTESWSMYAPAQGPPGSRLAPNGALMPSRHRLMTRTHARGVLGELLAYGYNVTSRGFFMTANVTRHVLNEAMGRARRDVITPQEQAALSALGLNVSSALCTSWTVPAQAYFPTLPRLLGQQGGVTEVYIPPTVPWMVRAVGPGASVRNVVTWPDRSRTAYIRLAQPGPYGVLVVDLRPADREDGHRPDPQSLVRARQSFCEAGLPWPEDLPEPRLACEMVPQAQTGQPVPLPSLDSVWTMRLVGRILSTINSLVSRR